MRWSKNDNGIISLKVVLVTFTIVSFVSVGAYLVLNLTSIGDFISSPLVNPLVAVLDQLGAANPADKLTDSYEAGGGCFDGCSAPIATRIYTTSLSPSVTSRSTVVQTYRVKLQKDGWTVKPSEIGQPDQFSTRMQAFKDVNGKHLGFNLNVQEQYIDKNSELIKSPMRYVVDVRDCSNNSSDGYCQ